MTLYNTKRVEICSILNELGFTARFTGATPTTSNVLEIDTSLNILNMYATNDRLPYRDHKDIHFFIEPNGLLDYAIIDIVRKSVDEERMLEAVEEDIYRALLNSLNGTTRWLHLSIATIVIVALYEGVRILWTKLHSRV